MYLFRGRWRTHFTKRILLQIFIDLSSTLYFLHENGICHYNINPKNILFDEFNKPKFDSFILIEPNDNSEKVNQSYLNYLHRLN